MRRTRSRGSSRKAVPVTQRRRRRSTKNEGLESEETVRKNAFEEAFTRLRMEKGMCGCEIAGALCKVSKRQVTAAREAEGCYQEYLLPFESRLQSMESGPYTTSVGVQTSRTDLVSSSESGSRTPHGLLDSYTPVYAEKEYGSSTVHVISVRIRGLPYSPGVPVLSGVSSAGAAVGVTPPGRALPEAQPVDLQNPLGNQTRARKRSTASSPLSESGSEKKRPRFQDAGIGKTPSLEGEQSHQQGGRGRLKRGWMAPTNPDDFADEPGPSATPRRTGKRRARKRGEKSAPQAPSAPEWIERVEDIVPGDKATSMVRWLKEVAAEAGTSTTAAEILHLRYAGELLRSRDKMRRSARQAYKEEAIKREQELEAARLASLSSGRPQRSRRRRRVAVRLQDSDVEEKRSTTSTSDSDEGSEPAETREGAEFQAEIPAWRPKPAVPSPDEARWLTGKIWPLNDNPDSSGAGAAGPSALNQHLIPAVPRPDDFLTSVEARNEWVDTSSQILEKLLGDGAEGLGLNQMGFRSRQGWSAEDEVLFERGIRNLGRDFAQLRENYLPEKDLSDVINYYYNIWKLQRTAPAREWYAERSGEKVDQQKEEEAARQKEVEEKVTEDERARETKVRLAQRRGIKTTIAWIKTIGRNPFGANLVQRSKTLARAVRLQEVWRLPTADSSLGDD